MTTLEHKHQVLLDKYLGSTRGVTREEASDLYALARPCGHCHRWTRAGQLRFNHCPACMDDPEIAAEAQAVRLM